MRAGIAVKIALAAAMCSTAMSVVPPVAARPAPVTTSGYIPMKDGVLLRYTLVRPSSSGRHPVVLNYGPYDTGEQSVAYFYTFMNDLLARGIAVLGINMRGTGCSGGKFVMLDPQQGIDGAASVEWAARQRWSNGRVGMVGISYEGISQLLTAGHRPPHLDAIAPGQILSDVYRDVGYPGGLLNRGFGALYPVGQAMLSYPPTAEAIVAGDEQCAINLAEHTSTGTVPVEAYTSPFTDSPGDLWKTRSPDSLISRIDVPVLLTRTWQDTQTGSRMSYVLEDLDPRRTWSLHGNGAHGPFYVSKTVGMTIVRFMDHYLNDKRNGWEDTPHVQVLHEIGADDKPAWTSTHDAWPPATKPLSLYLSSGGALRRSKPPADEGADRYAYPMLAPSAPNNDMIERFAPQIASTPVNDSVGWDVPPTPNGYLAYTTPRLTRDVEVLGSGNADLWLSSTAPDTDLQITLTEVRPDGGEIYLQRGWLRASRRVEDAKRSTMLRPFHTHRMKDERSLQAVPVHLRVELFPVGHVFRKGSSIRLIIDAPTGTTGDWALDFLNTPAVNTILRDAAHPSRVVLPLVEGKAHAKHPECGASLYEPCRKNIAPVPNGSESP